MKTAKSLSLAILVFFGVSQPVLSAQDDQTSDGWEGPRFIEKEWRESKTVIPDLPKDENLLGFKVYNSSFKHYIDQNSLNLKGGDNIARYTVVIVTSSGIRNIFHEGIRCDTARYKTYAYSINNSPFTPVRNPQWIPIPTSGTGAYRNDLYQSFLCKYSTIRGKKEDIIRLFKDSPDHYDYENVD